MEAFLCELVGRYVDEGREPNDVEMEFLEAMGINVIEVTP
jgi:hypothetical protein